MVSPELYEFVDANGDTWQMDEATGERYGYRKTSEEPIVIPPSRRDRLATQRVHG